MTYLLDTVTLIRHFTETGTIGKSAKKILDSEDQYDFVVSVISLMEIMYLAEKHRINISLSQTINQLNNSLLYKIVDLNPEIILVANSIDFFELHDRLILATTKWLDIPIISSDRKFDDVPEIKVIWK